MSIWSAFKEGVSISLAENRRVLRNETDAIHADTNVKILENQCFSSFEAIRSATDDAKLPAKMADKLVNAHAQNFLQEVNRIAPKLAELKHFPYQVIVEMKAGKVVGVYSTDKVQFLDGSQTADAFLQTAAVPGSYLLVDQQKSGQSAKIKFSEAVAQPIQSPVQKVKPTPVPVNDQLPISVVGQNQSESLSSKSKIERQWSTVEELQSRLVTDLQSAYANKRVDTPIHFSNHLVQSGRSCVLYTAVNALRALGVSPAVSTQDLTRDAKMTANARGEFDAYLWSKYFTVNHYDKYAFKPIHSLIDIGNDLESGRVVLILDPGNAYHAIVVSGMTSDGQGTIRFRVNDSLSKQVTSYTPEQLGRFLASGTEWVIQNPAKVYSKNREQAMENFFHARENPFVAGETSFYTAFSLSLRKPKTVNVNFTDNLLITAASADSTQPVPSGELDIRVASKGESGDDGASRMSQQLRASEHSQTIAVVPLVSPSSSGLLRDMIPPPRNAQAEKVIQPTTRERIPSSSNSLLDLIPPPRHVRQPASQQEALVMTPAQRVEHLRDQLSGTDLTIEQRRRVIIELGELVRQGAGK